MVSSKTERTAFRIGRMDQTKRQESTICSLQLSEGGNNMAPKGQSVAATQYASRLRNVRGTFAAEGMVLHELWAKYEKRG